MNNIGILDPIGKNDNPLTEKPYSEDYKKLAKVWSQFPAYQNAKNIIEEIRNHQVILVVAETGSGKTVLVPKYTLHVYNYTGKIAITLPKQMIARSAAEFSAKTLDVELGKEVGYQYRGSERSGKSHATKLLYATDGTIVARLLNDPELKDFDAVIVDEAHERKVQIDFLLFLLRETIRLRPEFKVIIMSATINAEIFKDYFSEFKFKQLNIAGKTNYPIDSIFLEKSISYKLILDKGFDIILKILEEPVQKHATDIMFFITSINEAFTMCKRLQTYLDSKNDKSINKKTCKLTCDGDIFCIEVYAGMDPSRQNLAQDKSLYKEQNNFSRKLVITTAVAESSLTIDGIKYVLDSGYELRSSYDPDNRAKKLDRQLISHAQAKQRMGRGGRTGPGICYHIYTKDDFDTQMKRFPEPDIRTNDISGECLRLLNLDKIDTVPRLLEIFTNFIEPPRENFIKSAITSLIQIGAIEDNKISKVGKLMAIIGTDPMASLALILSKIYNCSHEMIKIISIIETSKINMSNIFKLPKLMLAVEKDKKKFQKKLKFLTEKFDKARGKFKHKYGDHLSLLKMYEKFIDVYNKNKDYPEKVDKWCHEHFLKFKTLNKAKKNVQKNERQMRRIIDRNLKATDLGMEFREDIIKLNIDDRVMACLLVAFRTNTGIKSRKSKDIYKTQYSKDLRIQISSVSFLTISKTLPKHILYHELFISMGNATLNIVSNIPDKLIELLS